MKTILATVTIVTIILISTWVASRLRKAESVDSSSPDKICTTSAKA